ncbi:MAG: YlxM family DNA-binding protein [Velocimicrobium sp.]
MIDLSRSEKDQETLDRIVELSLLYDFYGALLKEQKRQVFEDYVLNDLSLSEIAQEKGISRQAVHDTVKRCSKELIEYEEKLSLLHKFQVIKGKVNEIHQTVLTLKEETEQDEINQIENLSNEILDVL